MTKFTLILIFVISAILTTGTFGTDSHHVARESDTFLVENEDSLQEDVLASGRDQIPISDRTTSTNAEAVTNSKHKRGIDIRMGLAANPDVETGDFAPEKRSLSSHQRRGIDIRMGLAANPDVETGDFAPEKRSLSSNHKREISIRMGLAANPEVMTKSEESTPRSLEKRSNCNETLPSINLPSKDEIKSSEIIEFSHDEAAVQPDVPINLNSFSKQKPFNVPLYRPKKLHCDMHLHPEIQFQQHLNHALQRHARLLKKPLDRTVLIETLRKRAQIYGTPSGRPNLQRRSDLFPRKKHEGYPKSAFFAQKESKITPPGETTAANSVGFSIEANDVGYFAEIEIGTPPTKFKLILDSGSSDTWVPLPECVNLDDSKTGCNHATLSRESSTLRRTTDDFKITYGTGSVKGVIVEETMIIGGLILTNHAFGGATAESKEFAGQNVPFDGLMGTGRSLLASQKVLTPIEAMSNSGILPGAFIGYALGRVSDGENIGQATFGGVDNTKFTGDLALFPNINTKGFWEGEMSEVKVDGVTVLTNRTGILDTGTTLIVAPAADAEAVHAKIPGSKSDGNGRFTIPCTTKSIVSLTFGGISWDIKPVDLTFQPVTRNLAGRCISGISSGSIGGPRQWLVGDTFLKGVYFATDATNNQMGLAVINHSTSSS